MAPHGARRASPPPNDRGLGGLRSSLVSPALSGGRIYLNTNQSGQNQACQLGRGWGTTAKTLREYRNRLGEAEGLPGLLRDLEGLGDGVLQRGSRYVLGCLRNRLEQGTAGRGELPSRRRRAQGPPNPFSPPDPDYPAAEDASNPFAPPDPDDPPPEDGSHPIAPPDPPVPSTPSLASPEAPRDPSSPPEDGSSPLAPPDPPVPSPPRLASPEAPPAPSSPPPEGGCDPGDPDDPEEEPDEFMKRLPNFERWRCSSCGKRWFTPRRIVPTDRVCHLCREGGEAASATQPVVKTFPREDRRGHLAKFLVAAGVPERYRSLSRRSWEEVMVKGPDRPEVRFPRLGCAFRDAWPTVLDGWTGKGDHWLVVLSGLYGTGKTGLATALFGEAIAAGLGSAVWLDAGGWLRGLRAGFSERDGSSDRLFERAASCELLLIDDLGSAQSTAETTSAWWRQQLALLLRERHMWNRPTILTCNAANPERAFGALDPSLPSRLDVPLQATLVGPNLRRRS